MLNAYLLELVATHNIQTVNIYQSKQNGMEAWQLMEDLDFDRRGNLIAQASYSESGLLSQRLEQYFDQTNRLIESTIHLGEGEWQKTFFDYDNEGNIQQEIITFSGGGKTVKRFDRNIFYEEVIQKDEEGSIERREYRTFNDHGKVVKENIYEGQSELIQEAEYVYDIHGTCIESFTFNREDLYRFHHYHEYDEQGREIRRLTHFEHGELLGEEFWKYDKNGLLLEHYRHGQLNKYQYNSQGQIIKVSLFNPDNSLQSFTSSIHDDQGLLIEQTFYDMGQAYEIEPQVIGRSLSSHLRMRYEYAFFDK